MKEHLKAILVLSLIIFILLLAVIGYNKAAIPQYWMYILEGSNGLDFYCTTSPVYQDLANQDYVEYARNPQDLKLHGHVIEVEACNLDNIYETDDGLFAWRFTTRDPANPAVHMTRGAVWVQLLSFDYQE